MRECELIYAAVHVHTGGCSCIGKFRMPKDKIFLVLSIGIPHERLDM